MPVPAYVNGSSGGRIESVLAEASMPNKRNIEAPIGNCTVSAGPARRSCRT